MDKKLLSTLLLVLIIGLIATSCLGEGFSEAATEEPKESSPNNFDSAFNFDLYYGHFKSVHTLHVSVPPSLYEYYKRKSHSISSDSLYARFATSNAFETIAENIKKATNEVPNSEEQFANAVLALVRQIPYIKSSIKYPVEALVENSGDCDVLSLLAASIMKAGGLDVVLLHYKDLNPSHMNIGVYLPYKPIYRSWWMDPAGFEYGNKTYWMAECTSRVEWKVGDKPALLTNIEPRVIPLQGTEKTAPAQVASRLDGKLERSSISVTFSPENSNINGEERSLAITGEVLPALKERKVTMYVAREGLSFETYKTLTDEYGRYSFIWNFTQAAKYTIVTSVGGISDFAGSDSEKLTVLAGVYEPIFEEGGRRDPFAWATSAPFRSVANQGPKYVLKNNVSGTGLLLSGEFMIISESDSGTPTIEFRIPRVERIVYFPRTRQTTKVIISEEQLIAIPVESNQLAFLLKQDGEEQYSASVGVLGDQQIPQMLRILQEGSATYMNATEVATRNKWYRVEATIMKNATNARLFETNNTVIGNIAVTEPLESGEMGILMSYPPNSILAFKNLRVSTLDEKAAPLPPERETAERSRVEWLAPYIVFAVLLAIGLMAVGSIRRKSKRNKPTNSIGVKTSNESSHD